MSENPIFDHTPFLAMPGEPEGDELWSTLFAASMVSS